MKVVNRMLLILAIMLGPIYLLSSRNQKPAGHTDVAKTIEHPKSIERIHPIAPAEMDTRNCGDCSVPLVPTDPQAIHQDIGLDGRLVLVTKLMPGANTLVVRVYAGGPVLIDPQLPDSSVRQTCAPEDPQMLVRGQECEFWFHPNLQAFIRWDTTADGHVVFTGRWHRTTYRQDS